MRSPTHPSFTTPAEHAALFEAARTEAARLHHQAITAFFDRLGSTVRRAFGASARPAAHRAGPSPQACTACPR